MAANFSAELRNKVMNKVVSIRSNRSQLDHMCCDLLRYERYFGPVLTFGTKFVMFDIF